MQDTVGERRPSYQTVDQRASVDRPVPLKKQKSFRASVASFAASMGVLLGTLTGHDPIGKSQEVVQDAASTTQNIASSVGGEAANRLDKINREIDGKPLIDPTPINTPPKK